MEICKGKAQIKSPSKQKVDQSILKFLEVDHGLFYSTVRFRIAQFNLTPLPNDFKIRFYFEVFYFIDWYFKLFETHTVEKYMFKNAQQSAELKISSRWLISLSVKRWNKTHDLDISDEILKQTWWFAFWLIFSNLLTSIFHQHDRNQCVQIWRFIGL